MTYRNLSEALFHGQLPMFMTAGEIKQHFDPRYGDRYGRGISETEGKFWGRKLQEATRRKTEDGTLRKSIREKGVQEPVALDLPSRRSKPEIIEGHHRVAVAAKDAPNAMLPVELRRRNWWEG